ncbi:sugar transferase [Macrococcoides bohemicum]|uniref:Sugar transferase n=1 Tax=Macrococcoides bohemicum TaxID=1903056 RepID=A0AAE7U7M3_9STAP|nr:sugar transferase [Macrococcus bohemicus]MBC9874254.1 sugar transferase [Macrococcus bohemicus]QRN49496.1 sugar transferase [Macrococcus bohemicus]QYA43237.1 sugar transferase [Macrococcus bohemicus]QYA45611.1 sugar transferase [Macrococcus bohemicus]
MKRLFDIAVSGTALVLLSPVIVTSAVLIKKKLGSPVLFKQTRPGKDGEPFEIYKFRTMTDERDAHGELLPDAERLTDFGKTLRKLSIDELPQLFNVLKGDISLVGPRPLLMQYLPLYNEHQKRRMEVRPGITGWAQVNGRNNISWEEKFDLDVWYVDHQSFILDLYIIYLTVVKVFKQSDISQDGHATVPAFTGTK